MLNALISLIQSNPGMASYAAQRAYRGVANEVERRKQEKLESENARQKAIEDARHRDEMFFKDAVLLEKMKILEEDPRTKKFSEELLLKFSEERLKSNLRQRISDYEEAANFLGSQRDERARNLRELEDRLSAAKRARDDYDRTMEKYSRDLAHCESRNGFYRAYARIMQGKSQIDDFTKLEIMSAAQEFGVDDREADRIADFAQKNRFNDKIPYLEKPPRPAAASHESESELSAQIGTCQKELSGIKDQISKLHGIVSALRARSRNATMDETPGKEKTSGDAPAAESRKDVGGDKSGLHAGDIVFDVFGWATGMDDVYVGPDIPGGKLDTAARSLFLPEFADVCILFDSTSFGSAENGMIVTRRAVYFRNPDEAPVRFSWYKMRKVQATEDGHVVVGEYAFNTRKGKDFAKELADSLCAIAQQLG